MSIKDVNHFKRNVETKLNNWGYQYKYDRKGVEITGIPEGEARLAEIMLREFNMNVQIDAFALACFIKAFDECECFYAMPWAERADMLKAAYGIIISERTLKSWGAKLLERGLIAKTGECIFWRTNADGTRELVEGNEKIEAEMSGYWERRNTLVKAYVQAGLDKSAAWKKAIEKLWIEYGCIYYRCGGFALSAYDDNTRVFQEIYEIVEEILQ